MKTINSSVLYFHDFETTKEDTAEEIRMYQRTFYLNGIEISKIKHTDIPPFGRMKYDILLFDWGGASVGNSMMDNFCRRILNEAIENPSKLYIMVSRMTADAMRDATEELGELPANVFLDIHDACKLLKEDKP
jgi:hypothetical protein